MQRWISCEKFLLYTRLRNFVISVKSRSDLDTRSINYYEESNIFALLSISQLGKISINTLALCSRAHNSPEKYNTVPQHLIRYHMIKGTISADMLWYLKWCNIIHETFLTSFSHHFSIEMFEVKPIHYLCDIWEILPIDLITWIIWLITLLATVRICAILFHLFVFEMFISLCSLDLNFEAGETLR